MQQSLPFHKIAADYANLPIFDVRSPSEFQRGHIPGAINLPLFDNSDREHIGLTYKKFGQQAAIREGLDVVGPRLRLLVETVDQATNSKKIILHCWRGGMRSESVGWLLQLCGYEVILIEGGYKAFRQFALATFEQEFQFFILGGYTGSGKTDILKRMPDFDQQIIDLEGLARHKGSAFGSLGEAAQPTQQQFENSLALQLRKSNRHRPIWLEDESRRIGSCSLPLTIWQQMRRAPLFVLEIPADYRTVNLMKDYGKFSPAQLGEAVEKLARRLGDQNMRYALELLANNNLSDCCQFLLEKYYDPMYAYGISQRDEQQIKPVNSSDYDSETYIRKLINLVDSPLKAVPPDSC